MKLTRRNLIRFAAGSGVAAMAAPWALAGEETVQMTTIPSSGELLPAVGIGTVGFRGDPAAAELAPLRETLAIFFQLGGRLIDTSPNYGNSETVVGLLLEELELLDRAFIATKVDREDRQAGIERMEGSFQRLGGRIDLMQVHNFIGTRTQMETLAAWRGEGRFRYIGVTTHRDSQHRDLEQAMQNYALDFIQVNYSLADRAAAKTVLPMAQDHGVAVLVNRPFGRGRLFDTVRGRELPPWAPDIDAASWGQVFLKYLIAHPAATIPIPGTTTPRHVRDNLAAIRGRLPDAGLRREMETYMDRLH
ncbi:MAG: aldo/keto reductase [Xanthomonadales bacterium]|nr:aldo/keto reductase [Xanthomonadales bacterium]